MLQRVMVILAIILDRDRLAQLAQLSYHLRIVFINLNWRNVFNHRLDLVEHVGHQHRMIG